MSQLRTPIRDYPLASATIRVEAFVPSPSSQHPANVAQPNELVCRMATTAEQSRQAQIQELQDEIRELARTRNAVLLAHNYERAEVQDVADFVGDSLGLSREAAKTEADVIVFCGVHFMAETAAILSPNKTVLLPDLAAGCSLASTIDAAQLREWKAEHPGAVVVAYVNTTAEVKAESDYCCTSGNAVEVINAIPADKEILFLPDMFLGAHVRRVTGRDNIQVWMGECHVHAGIDPENIRLQRGLHPDAEFLIHPECGCSTSVIEAMSAGDIDPEGVQILSTEGMIKRPRESSADEFIVATEVGILHRLRRENPGKRFHAANERASCAYMKVTTLPKVLRSLEHMQFPITVEPDIAARARVAIERMVAIGGRGGGPSLSPGPKTIDPGE
jgi:quinolinate synthase